MYKNECVKHVPSSILILTKHCVCLIVVVVFCCCYFFFVCVFFFFFWGGGVCVCVCVCVSYVGQVYGRVFRIDMKVNNVIISIF